jgi:hypothetical protein
MIRTSLCTGRFVPGKPVPTLRPPKGGACATAALSSQRKKLDARIAIRPSAIFSKKQKNRRMNGYV